MEWRSGQCCTGQKINTLIYSIRINNNFASVWVVSWYCKICFMFIHFLFSMNLNECKLMGFLATRACERIYSNDKTLFWSNRKLISNIARKNRWMWKQIKMIKSKITFIFFVCFCAFDDKKCGRVFVNY